jgi:hypothetical protein
MKRITLKITNNDQAINLPIVSVNNGLGYDDDVKSLISDETDNSINSVTDGEVRRILPDTSRTIQFQFWNGSTYVTQVSPLDFTSSQYSGQTARNSFYVIQVFNTSKEETQTKKHTGYFNGYDFAKTNLTSIYSFNEANEFSNLYLTQEFLDTTTGLTIDAYVKFLFYSAKSGKFHPFFNFNDPAVVTQDKLYHKITINKTTLRYSFTVNPIILRELNNTNYISLINETVSSLTVAKTTYPTGNTFTQNGSYITQ